jgi:hypothetical protein
METTTTLKIFFLYSKSQHLPFRCTLSQSEFYVPATSEQISDAMSRKRKHLDEIAEIAAREQMSERTWREKFDRQLYGEAAYCYGCPVSTTSHHEDPCDDPDMPFVPLGTHGDEDYDEVWRDHFRCGIDLARRRGYLFRELDNADIIDAPTAADKARIAEEMGLQVTDRDFKSRGNYRAYFDSAYCERKVADSVFCLCHCGNRDECPVHYDQ